MGYLGMSKEELEEAIHRRIELELQEIRYAEEEHLLTANDHKRLEDNLKRRYAALTFTGPGKF